MSAALHPSLLSLLEALSSAIGARIVLNAQGECGLQFEADVDLTLARAGDPDILSIRSCISTGSQPLDAELMRAALVLNYTELPPGYTIGLDDASSRLVLVALVDTVDTPQEQFLRLVAGFLDLVPVLRQRCSEMVARGGATDTSGMVGVSSMAVIGAFA